MKIVFRCDPAPIAQPLPTPAAGPPGACPTGSAVHAAHGLSRIRPRPGCPHRQAMPALHRCHGRTGFIDPAAMRRRWSSDGALSAGTGRCRRCSLEDHPALAAQLSRAPRSSRARRSSRGPSRPIKFNSFWTIELEEGWSLLAMHPANRLDLPFRLLTGVVDSDRFNDIGIFFPALWTDAGFSGVFAQRHAGCTLHSVSAGGDHDGIRRAFRRQGRALCGGHPGDSRRRPQSIAAATAARGRARRQGGAGGRPATGLRHAGGQQPRRRVFPRVPAHGRDCAGSRRHRVRSALPYRGARSRLPDVRFGARGRRADAGLWHGGARGEESRHGLFGRRQISARCCSWALASSWFSSLRFATDITPASSRPTRPPPRSSRLSRQAAEVAGAAASRAARAHVPRRSSHEWPCRRCSWR